MSFDVRRRLYNQLPQGYVTDGLVFELNASKGLSEDGWIEQISGKKFTWTEGSEKVFDNTGVHLGSAVGANGSFMSCENSTFNWIAASECSMDIRLSYVTTGNNSNHFNLGVQKGFSFHFQGSGSFYQCGVTSGGNYMIDALPRWSGAIYMNFKERQLYLNGALPTNRWGFYHPRSTTSREGNVAMLGANPDLTYPATHTIIRAIRIYNRPLTGEEILNNYNTDKSLFT